jgi:hypothetical protein
VLTRPQRGPGLDQVLTDLLRGRHRRARPRVGRRRPRPSTLPTRRSTAVTCPTGGRRSRRWPTPSLYNPSKP